MEEIFEFLWVLVPFIVFGFMFAKHRKETPSFLISMERMNEITGGSYALTTVLTAPLILLYNTIVWAGYSVVVAASFWHGYSKLFLIFL